MKKLETLYRIKDEKIVAVIRGGDHIEAGWIARGAIEGGIHIIELTYTTPNVEKVFKELQNEDALIGAGTVLDEETARHALLQGARFIVSPYFNENVAKLCNRYGIPYLPGCMTMKEMALAMEFGCDILKLFPASQFTPSIITSLKGPLPNLNLMPTGGVNLKTLGEWLKAGAIAVGVGSDLNKAFSEGSYEQVVKLSEKYVSTVRASL